MELNKRITNGIIDLVLFEKINKKNLLFKIPILAYNIYIHGTNTIIGKIDLRIGNIDNKEIYYIGNIGIDINELYQSKACGSMALNLIEEEAIKLNMQEITIACEPTNNKMQQLAENLNYELVDCNLIPNGTFAYLNGYRKRILFRKNLIINERSVKHGR